jgi:hypothetical protein
MKEEDGEEHYQIWGLELVEENGRMSRMMVAMVVSKYKLDEGKVTSFYKLSDVMLTKNVFLAVFPEWTCCNLKKLNINEFDDVCEEPKHGHRNQWMATQSSPSTWHYCSHHPKSVKTMLMCYSPQVF